MEKGLEGRRADRIMWAVVLLHNVDTLEVYEVAIRQSEEEPPPTSTAPTTYQAAGETTLPHSSLSINTTLTP